jgi:1,4-alpha-glucan branching enzyme
MAIKKEYPKNKMICKVTFEVPQTMSNSAAKAYVVGEFNNWSTSATPMKRNKKGGFTATLDLVKGHEYQFRYLLDKDQWENETEADKIAPTPFSGAVNSVIVV